MASMTTETVLQHEPDDLAPDCQPSFADVVYLLTTPPPDADPKQTWGLGTRLARYAALLAYSLAHPCGFALWLNGALRMSERIEDATYPEVWREWADVAKASVGYALSVAGPFFFAPRGPWARAREAAMQPMLPCGPLREGMVRIKWYPNVEATKRWPPDLGRLWVDVPVDHDGSVDLEVVMDLWGMENCHVIDANRSKPQLWRRPVERLSALAISVLLADGHKVIGVVECPSEPLQTAREYRTRLKHQAHQLLATPPRILRCTLASLAALAVIARNLTVYGPRLLWFFLCCSPYILLRTLEAVCLVLLAIGTIIMRDLEDLGHTVQGYFMPHVRWFIGTAREWLIAGLEAVFLMDEEIRRVAAQREGVRDVGPAVRGVKRGRG